MDNLQNKIKKLQDSDIRKEIAVRIAEFAEVGKKDDDTIFCELCFCLLTANYSAEGGMRIQAAMKDDFCRLSCEGLSARLKELRYRFPNKRAEYISSAQRYKNSLRQIISAKKDDQAGLRRWLADNIKGLGMKESSHFMRNIGFDDVAIIDFHIVDILAEHKLISRPKTLSEKRYLEIEDILRKLAKKAKLNLAELDLYLWYMETGKILK